MLKICTLRVPFGRKPASSTYAFHIDHKLFCIISLLTICTWLYLFNYNTKIWKSTEYAVLLWRGYCVIMVSQEWLSKSNIHVRPIEKRLLSGHLCLHLSSGYPSLTYAASVKIISNQISLHSSDKQLYKQIIDAV
jgi:hypothetical protein